MNIQISSERFPLVSVLMPAFNAERYLKESISSILVQTYKNFEFLIIDDGSTDNTSDILESFNDERIKIYKNKKNAGYLKACNKLFQYASGGLITFQDADDISMPNRIEVLVDRILTESLILCGSNVVYIRGDGKEISKSTFPLIDSLIKKRFLSGGYFPFCGSTVMVKSEAISSVGVYREYFDRKGAEDIDWIYRISFLGRIANSAEYLYCYRKQINSLTNSPESLQPLRLCSFDIANALYIQRLEEGNDDLDSNDNSKINKLENKYLKRIEENPHIKMSKLLNIYLLNKCYRDFFKTILTFIARNKNNGKCYLSAVMFLGRLVMGERIFGLIRNSVVIQRISRSGLE